MAKWWVPLALLLHGVAAHYTPTWAVYVPEGREAADAVAAEHGFINLGEIFDNHFHFHHNSVSRRSLRPAVEHHGRLENDVRVHWAKQQRALSRKKRDFQILYNNNTTVETVTSDPYPSVGTKREAGRRELQRARVKGRLRSLDPRFLLNDPKWLHMWYLNRGGGLDMNVIPAWQEGITGRGVVVTILDDGLETDHPDLIANYDPMASYDVNSHDSDPQPRYDMIDSNRHGTRCAGEVAATANNSLCAVGVAFGASVGGVRMLDGDVTDAVEARSLSLNPQHVDIYSASWGPDDDGKTVDGPGELATRAFIEGVTKGRNGKGSIFVWASGNGGREHDNCNCDGYTNSIWTLSISSATERGEVPWYSEMCSSTLATTYSSGAINEKQVVTTDLHHSCTVTHTGTSASAPLAAGICALALQANRDLTWRDMQHIVVRTARPERLSLDGNWRVNGVGRNVSHSFGYGLLDAAGMVRLARAWRTVPPQRRCELAAPRPQRPVPPKSSVVLQLDVSACPGVNYLEHVQARVSLSAARRGDLRIALTSPAGTRVTLLAPRAHDSSRAGFNSWPFMSVHMWGEAPLGVWQLEVSNEGRYMGRATLQEWSLTLYGTSSPAAKNDPIPFRPIITRNKSNATRPVVVQPRKNNRGKTVSSAPTYTVGLVKRKKNKNSKNTKGSQKMKQSHPATRSPIESTTPRVTSTPPNLSLNLQGNLADPLADARGRKMSNLFEQYPKIQRIYPAPLQANAGPLTQWELIFYGTETPAQEYDASPETNSLGTNGGGGGGGSAGADGQSGAGAGAGKNPWGGASLPDSEEVRQNGIDDDLALVWHDSHAIREEGLLGSSGSSEASGGGISGCATRAPQLPHRCLECAKGLHLYDGRCHTRCPDGTYASEILMERSSRRRNLTYFSEQAAASVSKSGPTTGEALDMEPRSETKGKAPLLCLPCHYTCATCSGPHSSQCTSCLDDAQLFNLTDTESKFYCYPNTVLPQITNAHWYYNLNVILVIVLVAFIIVGFYFYMKYLNDKCCFNQAHYNSNIKVAYNKLAVDEKHQNAIDIEEEIHKAIKYTSDSESEEELRL
ncbi:furin-like protease 1, isoforms 1/1-X/2 isoform X1 [Papilio machaon]|uniref:furin-like protease 1, isoforms 1/1-X/2 isoform X1 n=1 Tax=Papilio machaon TaxID=76193 RepID=UPI001E663ED0|nr:furin-like protease 1, isoforms 1/1-X/2 isoform X1 [Papilio machaon]XP_014368202.2 furin-like protease 1, isoforms 1/1-X/2 isoform X1 [Papilio machaon]XP_014368210.2 furin-like protease 1, isoforms 1/1-X/2 isoform X1 [Papilio machaon]XP_045538880.1 furin-like protease 1, isoforms 1/1-X/2 isoform X1 [Papilio machaon]